MLLLWTQHSTALDTAKKFSYYLGNSSPNFKWLNWLEKYMDNNNPEGMMPGTENYMIYGKPEGMMQGT